jgi:hypothetical protein
VSTTKDTRIVDGYEGSIAAEISPYGYLYDPAMPNMVHVNANPGLLGSDKTALLTPAAARALAAHLSELADEADLRNLEADTDA